jgi:hypothetical protein
VTWTSFCMIERQEDSVLWPTSHCSGLLGSPVWQSSAQLIGLWSVLMMRVDNGVMHMISHLITCISDIQAEPRVIELM